MKLYRIIANPEFELVEGQDPGLNRFILKIIETNAVGIKETIVKQNPNFDESNKLIMMEFKED